MRNLDTPISSREINIESAIDRSSFQLPVFVALKVEGGEDQVSKTFATAREVFNRIFSILLDRTRQAIAVAKVENLVPETAAVKNSDNTEYVLVVRGRAIFWFSSPAAKRAAGRRLLLEHARELAEAEQAPFYKLATPRRRRWAIGMIAILLLTAALSVIAARVQFVRQASWRPFRIISNSDGRTELQGWSQSRQPIPEISQGTFVAETPSGRALATVAPDTFSPRATKGREIYPERSLGDTVVDLPDVARIVRFRSHASDKKQALGAFATSDLATQQKSGPRRRPAGI